MKRLKLIVPAGRPGDAGMIAHAKLVDADTGEPIEPLQGVRLEFPFDDGLPGVVAAHVVLLIAEIETVPPEREAETFPGWKHERLIGMRCPEPESG